MTSPKNQTSSSQELSSDEEKPSVSPSYSPSPPPRTKAKRKAPAKSGASPTKKSKGAQANGSWSPEVRTTIMKYIFDRGMDGLNYSELSAIVGNLHGSCGAGQLTLDRPISEPTPQRSPKGQKGQLSREGDEGCRKLLITFARVGLRLACAPAQNRHRSWSFLVVSVGGVETAQDRPPFSDTRSPLNYASYPRPVFVRFELAMPTSYLVSTQQRCSNDMLYCVQVVNVPSEDEVWRTVLAAELPAAQNSLFNQLFQVSLYCGGWSVRDEGGKAGPPSSAYSLRWSSIGDKVCAWPWEDEFGTVDVRAEVASKV